MAEAVKDAVNQAVEGVKNLAVSAEQKAEQKAPKPKKEKKAKGGDADGRPLMLDPAPAYIDHRVQIL
jgi:threonyl-tRNA synthetase